MNRYLGEHIIHKVSVTGKEGEWVCTNEKLCIGRLVGKHVPVNLYAEVSIRPDCL